MLFPPSLGHITFCLTAWSIMKLHSDSDCAGLSLHEMFQFKRKLERGLSTATAFIGDGKQLTLLRALVAKTFLWMQSAPMIECKTWWCGETHAIDRKYHPSGACCSAEVNATAKCRLVRTCTQKRIRTLSYKTRFSSNPNRHIIRSATRHNVLVNAFIDFRVRRRSNQTKA